MLVDPKFRKDNYNKRREVLVHKLSGDARKIVKTVHVLWNDSLFEFYMDLYKLSVVELQILYDFFKTE